MTPNAETTTEVQEPTREEARTVEHALCDEYDVGADEIARVSDILLSGEGSYEQRRAIFHVRGEDGETYKVKRNYASVSKASAFYVSRMNPAAAEV